MLTFEREYALRMRREINDYSVYKIIDVFESKIYERSQHPKLSNFGSEYSLYKNRKFNHNDDDSFLCSAHDLRAFVASRNERVHATILFAIRCGLIEMEFTEVSRSTNINGTKNWRYTKYKTTEKGYLFHKKYTELLKSVNYFNGKKIC